MAEVQKRWRRRLRNGRTRVYVLQRQDQPVGYVAFGDGVPSTTSACWPTSIAAATAPRCWSSPAWRCSPRALAEASLWVLSGNEGARAFYRAHGWTETEERQTAEFPPFPEERKMVRRNPSAPRRSR